MRFLGSHVREIQGSVVWSSVQLKSYMFEFSKSLGCTVPSSSEVEDISTSILLWVKILTRVI